MREKILNEVKEAQYFSISVDSTPDITHTDQLTFILRYVCTSGDPVERFLTFIPLEGHDASSLTDKILTMLDEFGLDLQNCRGQSYDNASNMAGRCTGVQTRIKQLNPLASFVPCSAHSLNLVGMCAVESCIDAASFFGFIQTLYIFFSASTHRW